MMEETFEKLCKRKNQLAKERFKIAKELGFKIKEYDGSEKDLLRNEYTKVSEEYNFLSERIRDLLAFGHDGKYLLHSLKRNRLQKFTKGNTKSPVYLYVPRNAKLGVKDYRVVVGIGALYIFRQWSNLIAPLYNNEQIIKEVYDKILKNIKILKEIKLNRGKKDAQLKKFLFKEYGYEKSRIKTTDWYGNNVSSEIINEVWNHIDVIIDIITGKIKGDIKEWIDNYLDQLTEQ